MTDPLGISAAQQDTLARLHHPTMDGYSSYYASEVMRADGTVGFTSDFKASAPNPWGWDATQQQATYDRAVTAGDIILLNAQGGLAGTLATSAAIPYTPPQTLNQTNADGSITPVPPAVPVSTPLPVPDPAAPHPLDTLPVTSVVVTDQQGAVTTTLGPANGQPATVVPTPLPPGSVITKTPTQTIIAAPINGVTITAKGSGFHAALLKLGGFLENTAHWVEAEVEQGASAIRKAL